VKVKEVDFQILVEVVVVVIVDVVCELNSLFDCVNLN